MKKLLSFIVASAIALSSVAAYAAPNRFGVETADTVSVGLVTKLTNGSNDGANKNNPCIISVSSSGSMGTLNAKATLDMTEVKEKWNEYIAAAEAKGIDREIAIEYVDIDTESAFTLTIKSDPQITNAAGANTTLHWGANVSELFEQVGDAAYTEGTDNTTYTVNMKFKSGANKKLDNYLNAATLEPLTLDILGSSVSGVNTVYEIESTFSGTIVINIPGHPDDKMTVAINPAVDYNYVKQVISGGGSSGGGGGGGGGSIKPSQTPTATPTTTPTAEPTESPEVPEEIATTVEPQLQGTSSGAKLNYVDHYAYIIGYDDEDGTEVVRPENPITRAEVATIFYRLLTEESRNMFRTQSNNFSDVEEGDWYNNNISTVAAAGIVNGYDDGTFGPDKKITRAEFAAIAARFTSLIHEGENLFTDITGHWAEDAINNAAITGWINGYDDGSFDPEAEITRAEAITLINRVLYRYVRDTDMHNSMIEWKDNTEDKWYYEAVQEATNSHDYARKDIGYYESHTEITAPYDWESHEK